MATSINSYSVRLSMDASGFVDATKVSRSEARQLIRDIESARDPFEKFAVEQDRLKRALDSGAISQEVYNRLLESKKPAVEAVANGLHIYAGAMTAVAGAAASAIGAGTAFVAFLRMQQGAIDDTADAAERLGLSFTEIKSLRFGFAEGGGIDSATVDASIKKLQINMAKAVDGDEGLRKAFAKLGLDAGELIGRGPQQAILAIADKMQAVGTHAERLQIAMDLFGKSGAELASTLGKGSQSLAESLTFQEKWNSLTDAQVGMVGANNDAWDRIGIVIEGISNTIAAEFAPAMLMVAEHVLGVADSFEDIDNRIRKVVDNTVLVLGTLQDIIAMRDAWMSGGERPKLDSGIKMLRELEEKRRQFEEEGKEAAFEREKQRQTMLADDAESNQKKLDALKKEADREANQAAAAGLRAAEKFFEDERRKQEKMRADVAKGPGSGMQADSGEAARFLAQQANQAIAEATVQVDAKPTDQQLIEQAKIQVSILRAAEVKQNEMISSVRGVQRAIEDNGWEAV